MVRSKKGSQLGLARAQYCMAFIENGFLNLSRYAEFQMRCRMACNWFFKRVCSRTRYARSWESSLICLAFLVSSDMVYLGSESVFFIKISATPNQRNNHTPQAKHTRTSHYTP